LRLELSDFLFTQKKMIFSRLLRHQGGPPQPQQNPLINALAEPLVKKREDI
jgi:hypothetical protein